MTDCDFRSPTNGDDTIYCHRRQGQRPARTCNETDCGGWEHKEPPPDYAGDLSKLRKGIWGLLPDFENTVRRMTDLPTATRDLQGLITKLKLLLGPPRDEDEAACYGATTIRQAEDEAILKELGIEATSMGCQAEGPSPCSVCREAEEKPLVVDGPPYCGEHMKPEPCEDCGKPVADKDSTLSKPIKVTVKAPDLNAPTIVSDEVGGVEPVLPGETIERITEEMQSGQTEVDQEAVNKVVSELPNPTSEQWTEMCPTVGWEGEPVEKCPTCGLPLPPRNKGLFKEGKRVEIPIFECASCGQPDVNQLLDCNTGSTLPLNPVEVIQRYPEQAFKVMQRVVREKEERERIWQGRLEDADKRYERLRQEKLDALTKHREAMDEAERLYRGVVDDNQKLVEDLTLAKKVAMDNGQVPMSSVEDDMELLRKELEGK